MKKQVPIGGLPQMEQFAEQVQGVTTVAVLGTVLFQTLLIGTMAQVWGMINGLQLIVHLPLVNLLFPGNVMEVVSAIISVATFDIPYVDMEHIFMPFFGPVFSPPFDDAVLTDYPP